MNEEKDYSLGVNPEVQKKTLLMLGITTREQLEEALKKPFNVGMFTTPVAEVLERKRLREEKEKMMI